jgi:hypothetical protein
MSPKDWSVSKQVSVLAELGVVRPEEVAVSLLQLVDPNKAMVLRLGHWPRRSSTQATPQTFFALNLVKLLLNVAAAYSPGFPVTAILVEQRSKAEFKLFYPSSAIRISQGEMGMAIKRDDHWHNIFKCQVETGCRHMVIYMGTNGTHVPAKQRQQLKRSGFSLKFLK